MWILGHKGLNPCTVLLIVLISWCRRYCRIFLSSWSIYYRGYFSEGASAIKSWLRLNSLFINVTRETMLFGTLQRLAKVDQFSVSVNGSAIRRATEFKYLGVIFDEHLTWNEHVTVIMCLKLVGGSVCYDMFAVMSPHIVQMTFFIYD